MNEVVPSLSDIAAVTNANRNNGFGDGNGWWILVILFALWGNNGWGGFGGSGSGSIQQGYTLASDFATLERQIDSGFQGLERKGDFIQEQQCNSDQMMAQGFANVNTNLLTNAAGLNNTLATNFATVNQGISNNRYENAIASSNAQNAIQTQLSECCCQNRYDALQNTNTLASQLADNRYADSMNTNLLNNAISNGFCTSNYNNATNTRDIIDAVNANGRETRQMINDMIMDNKDAQIADLTSRLNNANLAASQARQTNQIIDSLEPKVPQAAYVVPNPFTGCGCNSCGNYNF